MAKFYRHEVIVEGRGPFPLDMLRYDRCYPQQEGDSYQLEASFHSTSARDGGPHSIRVETVRTDQRFNPFQTRRWASFGWNVVDQTHVVEVVR